MKHNILKSLLFLSIGLGWAFDAIAQNSYTIKIVGTDYATCIVEHNRARYTASTEDVQFKALEGDKIKIVECIPYSDAYDNTSICI